VQVRNRTLAIYHFASRKFYTYRLKLHLTSLNLVTMPNTSVPPRQIATRASNKTTHPGNAVKTTKRRTTAEVQEERAAKAQAKAAREEARQQSINRAAEFERADMVNEDLVDATPRPPFTPKKPQYQTHSDLTPLAETSDADMSDGFEKASFVPPASEHSDTADESADESDTPRPAKKLKAEPMAKMAATKAATKKAAAKKVDKKKNVDDSDVEIVAELQPPQEPKPKKVKPRMRDEIAKKIEENKSQGGKYADMLKSTSGKRPAAPKGPSGPQATVVGGKKLQREGAIADISTFGMEIPATEPDQVLNSKQNNPAATT
jgi:hypothetical protein